MLDRSELGRMMVLSCLADRLRDSQNEDNTPGAVNALTPEPPIMKLPAVLCLSCLFPGLVPAERTPEEWYAEFVERYNKLESYRAVFTAVSQDKEEPLRGFVLEDRSTGACLLSFGSEETGQGTMWWLPSAEPAPEDGRRGRGTTFAQNGGETFRVHGVFELMYALDDLGRLGGLPPTSPRRPNAAPAIWLGEEHISFFVASVTTNNLPWLSRNTLERVEEVRELAATVEFVLDDGSWIQIQKDTGLLAGQGYPVEEGERKIVLEAVRPLTGPAELRKEVPEINPEKIQDASVSEAFNVNTTHAQLFQTFLRAEKDGGPEAPIKLLAGSPGLLHAYWQAAWGNLAPPGVPAALVKNMQDLAGQRRHFRAEWRKAKEARPFTMKDVTFPRYFRQRREELRRDLRKELEAHSDSLPSVAGLETFLDGEIARLKPGEVARGRKLAAYLVQSQFDAMVMSLLPPATDEELDPP